MCYIIQYIDYFNKLVFIEMLNTFSSCGLIISSWGGDNQFYRLHMELLLDIFPSFSITTHLFKVRAVLPLAYQSVALTADVSQSKRNYLVFRGMLWIKEVSMPTNSLFSSKFKNENLPLAITF